MARVYQAVLHGSGDHLGRALRRSAAAVLGVPDDGSPLLELDIGGARVVFHDDPSCGRYAMDNEAGRMRLTALWGPASSPSTAWAVIAVDTPSSDAAEAVGADTAQAIEIVSGLLDAERAFDGSIPLETSPVDVGTDEVDVLLAHLLNPRRRVPVIVLSVDEREPALPALHATHLARLTAGTAMVARLCDKTTQNRMNDALGEGFAVYGGALRTYLAELDPATEDYPSRHPVRGGSKLRDLGTQALDVVVNGVTRDTVLRALPQHVRHGLRLVPQVLSRGTGWFDARTPARPAVPASRPRPAPTPFPVLSPGAASGPGSGSGSNAAPTRPTVPAPRVAPGIVATANGTARAAHPVRSADWPVAPTPGAAGPEEHTSADRTAEAPARPSEARPSTEPLPLPAAWTAEITRIVSGQLAEVAEAQRSFAGILDEIRHIADKFEGSVHAPARDPERDAESDALAAELARLRDDYDLLVLQYEELAEESRRSEDRIRRLDGLLAEESSSASPGTDSGADTGTDAAYDVWVPDCLADVLLRARSQLPHVSLPDTLDAGAATLDKAEAGHTRVWAGAAWDALRALDAYAAARSANTFRGGFHDWCRNPPHGAYTLSPKKFAMKESDAVAGRAKFRKARTFPVPPEVTPDASVFMEAHIKLRCIGNPAPRMHFHDDAAGATGRIHIGYLGHHLDNTRTN